MNHKKAFRITVILLLLAFQSLFLMGIFREQLPVSHWKALFAGVLCLTIWLVYWKIPIHHPDHVFEQWEVALWVPVGAVCCYFINVTCHLGPVIAAGLTGTLASYIPNISRNNNYLSQLPIAVYCGAFAGMCSASVAGGYGFIITSGILTGFLFYLSKSLFLGIGGKLGTLAFISVNCTVLIFQTLPSCSL